MSKCSCTTGKCAKLLEKTPQKKIHKQDASSNSCRYSKNILTVSLKICLFLLKPSSGRYLAQLYITAPTAETSETVVFYRPRRPKKKHTKRAVENVDFLFEKAELCKWRFPGSIGVPQATLASPFSTRFSTIIV